MALHFYIKPFIAADTYASEFTEVTGDVSRNGIGSISQYVDSSEYDVGVFRYSTLRLNLRNDHGKYSAPGELGSIFSYKRANSIVKITWEPLAHGIYCGFFALGVGGPHYCSGEITIFEGLLNDEASNSDINDQEINFTVMGYESFLSQMEVPYSSLANGDTASEILYTILNQAPLTDHVTVSQSNIVAAVDTIYDDVSQFENKTVLQAVKIILNSANSIMRIDLSKVLYVAGRDASSDTQASFYGQASELGVENIVNIQAVKSGQNRIINYLPWKDSTEVASDTSSIAIYGIRRPNSDMSDDGVTDSTKRNTILAALVTEFAYPQREFTLVTRLTPDVAALELLDKVQVDYPTIYFPTDEQDSIPFYGSASYEIDTYPDSLFTLTIDAEERYKIISKQINVKSETMSLDLRRVS